MKRLKNDHRLFSSCKKSQFSLICIQLTNFSSIDFLIDYEDIYKDNL